MAGGRPTEYKPEYADMLRAYFEREPMTEVERSGYDAEGKPCMVIEQVPTSFPTLAGFACMIGVHRETLLNWSAAHPEFFDAYKMAKEHQERILVENGLMGRYEKTFAIFTAKNVIGWRDKQEIEHSGDVGISDRLSRARNRATGESE